MIIQLCGLSHKTAPVAVREKVSFSPSRVEEAVRLLHEDGAILENVILSTCNRVEVYAVTHERVPDRRVAAFIARFHQVEESAFSGYLYAHWGMDAISHLFRVVTSLDSMVVGEPQVFGQVREAYGVARRAGCVGEVLTRVFDKALDVGRVARSATRIGKGAVSISSVSVGMAKKIFGSLKGTTVLIIGSGKVSELTLKQLTSSGIKKVLVANRTFDRARELALRFRGEAIPFERLLEQMQAADIVISSTNAPHLILHKASVEEVMERRGHRPLFFIDTAVPRDIAPEIKDINNVYLYNIDDLARVREANIEERLKEVREVEAIIEEALGNMVNLAPSLCGIGR
jgi:glutamyl-tRNA reductase